MTQPQPITKGLTVSITVPWHVAPLVSQMLDHEGYAGFWIRSCTDRVKVITDAPRAIVDSMIVLAGGQVRS